MKEYIVHIPETEKDYSIYGEPIAPAKELIRCKNCKYWIDNEKLHWWCSNLCMKNARPDWYCADGVKRDG